MLFNSIPFALFLPVVFILYWSLFRKPLALQNAFLFLASCVFYAWIDWRFLLLVAAGSLVDYAVGRGLGSAEDRGRRRLLLGISLFVNLGLLGFFKYYDFFVTSFCGLLGTLGLASSPRTLGLVLPVGISFYTFKKLSYTIDVYRRRLEPTSDALAFMSFVAFFPQLLAGPIDRASTLLPQFLRKREFSDPRARDGLRQMLSGFMKKMLIADNLAPIVDDIFRNYAGYDGVTLATGLIFAAIQIYCDFSGYSDIAIGCARLLGFDTMQNFAFPFFSRDIAEFWRRWHISLSTWLRDYLYVPLCGTRPSRRRKALSIVGTFVICGLWHGASWTYATWGFIHGLLFLPLTLARRHPRYIGTPADGRFLPGGREALAMFRTFAATTFAWVFFQSGTLGQAFGIIGRAVSHPLGRPDTATLLPLLAACLFLMLVEWLQRKKRHFLEIEGLPVAARWLVYCASVLALLVFGAFGSNQFIYSQF